MKKKDPLETIRHYPSPSGYYREFINDINSDIRKLGRKRKIKDHYLSPKDADAVWDKCNGRCSMCAKPLTTGRTGGQSPRPMFYIPLKWGGHPNLDNLILVCRTCKKSGATFVRRPIERILGIDTFADLCEALFKAIKNDESEDLRRQIKYRMNLELEGIVNMLRGAPYTEFLTEDLQQRVEGKNTLPDLIEAGDKKEVTNAIQQIVTTKKYNIMRNPDG